jgi:hypothetical protein
VAALRHVVLAVADICNTAWVLARLVFKVKKLPKDGNNFMIVKSPFVKGPSKCICPWCHRQQKVSHLFCFGQQTGHRQQLTGAASPAFVALALCYVFLMNTVFQAGRLTCAPASSTLSQFNIAGKMRIGHCFCRTLTCWIMATRANCR